VAGALPNKKETLNLDYALESYSNSLAPQLSRNKQRNYKLNFGRKGAKAQI
jgi:hypothetical protein